MVRERLDHHSPPDPAGKAQTLAGDLPREFEHSRDQAIAHFFGTSDPAQIDDARCRYLLRPRAIATSCTSPTTAVCCAWRD